MVYPVFLRRLEDMSAVFDRLDHGEQIVLVPPEANGAGAEKAVELRPPPDALDSTQLGFYSSGTTGQPKIIWRAWSELKDEVLPAGRYLHWSWVSPFHPWSYAGVQVALQAWVSEGRALSLTKNWTDNWKRLRNMRVNALSCTPTFIDLLLQQESPKGKKIETRASNVEGGGTDFEPEQITLGGEVLRPVLGKRLRERFPKTRFTVIYASAEWGVLFKTHRLDGWYETRSWPSRQRQWRVESGQLEVWGKGLWRETGDLVEINGDLIRIIGRADAVANVAGRKVNLSEISGLAEQVPGVRRAQAVAEGNSVTGQIVALRYAVEPRADPAQTRFDLEGFLRSHLPKEAWPRRWEENEVGLGTNAKRAK